MASTNPNQSRVGMSLVCDMCNMVRGPGDIRPFALVANVLMEDGSRSTRSFGSLDLCRRCWKDKASTSRQSGHDSSPFKEESDG